MDTAVLAEKLNETVEGGKKPFFVGGTARTTVRGAYDSIKELLELRQQYQFWLHVDGTWDFHKMLGTALMCNVSLINNRTHTLGECMQRR